MAKAPKAPVGPSFETGMLAYARSVQITEGLFFATSSQNDATKTPIEVLEKGVRGQSSEDKAKNPGKSNPQSVEYAVIPQEHDGVELSFSVRFMALSLRPHACGNTMVGETHVRLAAGYKAAGGYSVLAGLFAWNIANARFAWRNRFQADAMTVTVSYDGREIVFDPFKLSLEQPAGPDAMQAAMVGGDTTDLTALIDGIAHGLSNADKDAFTVSVRWNAPMLPGQEIFPSQEYVRDAKKDDQLSRIYAKLPTRIGSRTIGQASMHSQKIGAALRHIDVWHGSDTHDAAIAVNPYGGVQETSDVLRSASANGGVKNSFYDLRAQAAPLLEAVETASGPADLPGDVHFVMANLVRGGVFGSSSKKAEANG
ncbi:CRISPR-associated protein Csy3 [Roseivivax halotolerans]|uniref:CRISPR-associated protein Csy3 n=1 Tax=Roseivivax halotolerans TaxID=93684 RepID=A0A1I6AKD9_9RHOB|nr:type I-F CRISPR-associated protein Csy3 [Roseivivax halotolerans]SFQ69134.1 CRISPR-associated protein Csy3 [Roseivivax halotolerans]